MISPDYSEPKMPHWPALLSYMGALGRMTDVRLNAGSGSGVAAPDAADAWHLSLQDADDHWLVSVSRPADAGRPAWREPVLLSMLEAMERNLSGSKPLREWPQAVQKAWNLVTGHACRTMSLAEVAACVDLSAGYLGEQFERILGSSFKRILRDERVAHACHLLEATSRRVSEIARGIGGLSLSQFNRNFAAATGLSPSEWRDRHARRSAPQVWAPPEQARQSSPA